MNKLTLAAALLVASLATAGQLTHPSSPLSLGGVRLPTTVEEWPSPFCPPCRK